MEVAVLIFVGAASVAKSAGAMLSDNSRLVSLGEKCFGKAGKGLDQHPIRSETPYLPSCDAEPYRGTMHYRQSALTMRLW